MDNPCKHLVDYKLRYGLSGFKCLQKYIKTTPIGRTSIVKCGNKIPRCSSCDRCEGRLYICLICHAISCKSHALSHTQLECGHNLYVDVERSELYCSLCSDLVYDPDFDNVVVSKTIMDIPCNNSNHSLEYVLRRSCKRRKRRLDSMVDLDLNKAKRLLFSRDGKEKSCYPLGLRGLNNLGSTCFMNSILQALVHAPPFRNYFLGDRHDRDSCKKRSPSEHRVCLACEIAVIFSAVFSGDRTPYTPAQFLYSWWQHSVDLACYEQQDAHEFFMSLLDGIHEKEGKERNPCKGNGDCPCIAHRVFSGLLRSDVTCMTCGFTSTTYDPCVDISLNFDLSNVLDTAGKSIRPNNGTADSTLSACLDFFTRPEKLGSDQKLYCQNCHEKRDSLKQMSIRRLPLVLSFHIKRFEHSLVRRTSKKIDWHLSFPFSLDMTPYLSSSIARGRFGNRVFAFETDEADTCAEFEIFAVVTHSGTLESGHYVTYLRLRNEWYKCDDAWITKVDEDVVRAAQCYLLFYVQKMFYYKAYEDFSSTHVSPRRELFHPIAGCC